MQKHCLACNRIVNGPNSDENSEVSSAQVKRTAVEVMPSVAPLKITEAPLPPLPPKTRSRREEENEVIPDDDFIPASIHLLKMVIDMDLIFVFYL